MGGGPGKNDICFYCNINALFGTIVASFDTFYVIFSQYMALQSDTLFLNKGRRRRKEKIYIYSFIPLKWIRARQGGKGSLKNRIFFLLMKCSGLYPPSFLFYFPTKPVNLNLLQGVCCLRQLTRLKRV